MPRKSWTYAMVEGITQAAEQFDNDIVLSGARVFRADFPGLPSIDLLDKFGPHRVTDYSALDEVWFAGAALGSALIGVHAIDWNPQYMTNAYFFELMSQHAGKLHHMTGGQVTIPMVLITAISSQAPGFAGQHSDYEEDSWYAHLPGVKTIVPSTVYDAKGMLITSLLCGDPVVFFEYATFRGLVEDVPNELYEVPIGKAAIRTEGSDITIVGSGGSMPDITQAVKTLQSDGVSVESIDLRTLHPMDTETLCKSVEKTRRLLTVDQSKYTLCPGAEVIARVAEGVPGAKFKRIAFPDAPPPGAPEMFVWMKPNQDHVYRAAKMLLE